MKKFLNLSEADRSTFFKEAADRMSAGISATIIEKDFWVCWALGQLYSHDQLSKHITFKGGTSLSKAYHLIDRFSEDIDLTISKDAPYLTEGANPMDADISGKERQRRIDILKSNARRFVAELALPALQEIFSDTPSNAGDWKLVLEKDDPDQQTIAFFYPKLMNYGQGYGMGKFGVGHYGGGEIGYIKPAVKLEFGARGDSEPSETKVVTPYIAETFPQLFDAPSSPVHVLAAERTFWEKVTILHALYHGSKIRDRMSRHYYDTFIMAQKGVADAALKDTALLERVVRNKNLLFQDSKASYETAVIGSLHLVPRDDMMAGLKSDYAAMNEMLLSEAPAFEALMDSLLALEKTINEK